MGRRLVRIPGALVEDLLAGRVDGAQCGNCLPPDVTMVAAAEEPRLRNRQTVIGLNVTVESAEWSDDTDGVYNAEIAVDWIGY